MTRTDFPSVMTLIFVLVDDWLQSQTQPHERNRPCVRAQFSDSEVRAIALLMDYLPFPGETQFLGFIRANDLEYFPQLLDQTQFNRRLRSLTEPLEQLPQHWVMKLLPV